MTLRPPLPSTFARKYLDKMAIGQMTSTISIERPSEVGFDATTGQVTAGSATHVWSGPARVYSETGSLTTIGGELVSLGQTYISIPQSAPLPRIDDLVTVTSTSDDVALVNQQFRVVDVAVGGVLSPTRNLTVTTFEPIP